MTQNNCELAGPSLWCITAGTLLPSLEKLVPGNRYRLHCDSQSVELTANKYGETSHTFETDSPKIPDLVWVEDEKGKSDV